MTKSIAILFSGQGSQFVGMGKDLYDSYSIAKDLFDLVDDTVGYSLKDIMFNGPQEKLLETEYSQLAIYTHSYIVFKVLSERIDIKCSGMAGLSLGEYTSLTASERISFEDGLKIVQIRGRLMNEACKQTSGGMAAVIGLDASVIEENIQALGEGVWIANYNAQQQIVISGIKEKVLQAIEIFKAVGAKKVIPLNVFGAFHSPLMQFAEEGLAPHLYDLIIRESNIPVISNVLGDFVMLKDEVLSCLVKQITSPTLWYQGCLKLSDTADIFLEMGPGKVLAGLNRLIGIKHSTYSLGTVDQIDRFLLEHGAVI